MLTVAIADTGGTVESGDVWFEHGGPVVHSGQQPDVGPDPVIVPIFFSIELSYISVYNDMKIVSLMT